MGVGRGSEDPPAPCPRPTPSGARPCSACAWLGARDVLVSELRPRCRGKRPGEVPAPPSCGVRSVASSFYFALPPKHGNPRTPSARASCESQQGIKADEDVVGRSERPPIPSAARRGEGHVPRSRRRAGVAGNRPLAPSAPEPGQRARPWFLRVPATCSPASPSLEADVWFAGWRALRGRHGNASRVTHPRFPARPRVGVRFLGPDRLEPRTAAMSGGQLSLRLPLGWSAESLPGSHPCLPPLLEAKLLLDLLVHKRRPKPGSDAAVRRPN